jgi:hypothetical protein
MRKLVVLLIVFLALLEASAQDKIITVKNDTIYCRIVSFTDVAIIYEQNSGAKMKVGKLIPLSDVAEYHRLSKRIDERVVPEKPWALSLSLGGANMPWMMNLAINESYEDLYSKLKYGAQFSVSGHYFLSQYFGLGLQYSFFTSGFKGDFLNEVNSQYPTYAYNYLRECFYMNYVGISGQFQQSFGSSKRFFLNETVSCGVLLFRGESQATYNFAQNNGGSAISMNSLAESQCVAGSFGLSAGYAIRPDMTVGVGVDLLYGRLKTVDSEYRDSQNNSSLNEGVELSEPVNISRLNYAVVLRYTL